MVISWRQSVKDFNNMSFYKQVVLPTADRIGVSFETAHQIAIGCADYFGRMSVLPDILEWFYAVRDPSLTQTLCRPVVRYMIKPATDN